MVNKELVKIFNQMADLMEIRGENRFRVNSYRTAADSISELSEDIAIICARNGLQAIPGVGKGISEKICEYLETGRIGYHHDLLAEVPEGLPRLLEIPGLGPKKVEALHRQLGVGSIDDLKMAIAAGAVQKLAGFGEKSVKKILEGIEFLSRASERMPLGAAWPLAQNLRDTVAGFEDVKQAELAGSIVRGKETVGDIDIICVADNGAAVVECFTRLPQATAVRAAGETKGSIVVLGPRGREIQVDLRVVPRESFGAALQYFTGSKEHNIRLRELAIKKGWLLNEYGLFEGERLIAGETQESIYAALGLKMPPPEVREDKGEIECRGDVPRLVELGDIQGDLHMHTTASDGRNTLEEMVEACRALGYRYAAITNHSRSSVIANGLSVERLREHVAEVKAARAKYPDFTIFTGIECDVLPDATLDYPDDILAELDWVVASVHVAQGQERRLVTKRALAALENPYVCVLGHPSGRLLGKRDAMDIDWDAVFKTAARTGTALEINASWQRLDLKDVHVRQALEAGCLIAINTDAHTTGELTQMPFGIKTARRGWAPPERVLNTWPAERLTEWICRKRQRKA